MKSIARGIGRRDALALLGSVAALLPAVGHGQAPTTIDRSAFLRASSLVTGVAVEDLTGLADPLLAAFQAQSAAVIQIAALARTATPDGFAALVKGGPLEVACQQLATAWYGGMIPVGGKPTVVSYDDALAWKVAGFDTTPGTCAGEFGFWSEPPATH